MAALSFCREFEIAGFSSGILAAAMGICHHGNGGAVFIQSQLKIEGFQFACGMVNITASVFSEPTVECRVGAAVFLFVDFATF